jgi:hypothetical protein
MTRRDHFKIWEWVDFVRGMSTDARATAMREHLSSGCKRCDGLVRVLRAFAERASQEPRYEPPAEVVRLAHAIFPSRRPERNVFARLVYDSFRDPLPVGLRAEDRLARHALYEAGDVVVDLQFEQEPGTDLVTLVGQISDRDIPKVDTTSLPVLLMTAKGLVASAVCNRLGEFEMEYKATRDLRLYVPVRQTGGHLQLRMDDLAPAPVLGTRSRVRTGRRRTARVPRANRNQ